MVLLSISGEIMYQRDINKQTQLNVIVLKPSDDEKTKKIKELIQKMVCYVPHERAKAQDLKRILQGLSAPEV